jgi:hypothetical protein
MILHGKTEIGMCGLCRGLDRVLTPWRELIAFVRSNSAAKVQFDLIEGTLSRKLLGGEHEAHPSFLPDQPPCPALDRGSASSHVRAGRRDRGKCAGPCRRSAIVE